MKGLIIALGIILLVGFSVIKFIIHPIMQKEKPLSWKSWSAGTLAGLFCLLISGSFYYAEPGYSYLVQYPWGTQKADLMPGYHFYWYGTVIEFKKVITVRLTDESDKNSETATAMDNSVLVRFNDSVRATVSSSTRFRLPENETQFISLANDYRSMGNLVSSSLVPVTKEVIRNSARELSAQDYVTGQGGQFESNVLDQLENGIVVLKLEDGLIPTIYSDKKEAPAVEVPKVELKPLKECKKNDTTCEEENIAIQAENDKAEADAVLAANGKVAIAMIDEDRGVKNTSSVYQRVVRVHNADGSLKRKKHPIEQYGIKVTQSTIERVQPERKFQEMLAKQRDAAARAAVSRQEAKQAEYERQKIIANGETEKARVKMEQERIQTERVTQAETAKKEAEISLQTAEINKNKARVEADALLITKKAEAEGKRVVMVADGALEQKLDALVQINAHWAQAASGHSMVPATVVGGDGKGGAPSAADFMSLMTAMAAQQVGVDVSVRRGQ